MSIAPTRWGIAGSGLISSDFVTAIYSNLNRNDHKIVAVATRALEKAEQFAKKFEISKSYGSYKELASDPEVDVVYIGTIHTTHLDLCKLFMEAGKNVLCEKPLAMNVIETEEMLEVAKKKQVFFMEALWSRFNPAMKQLSMEIDNGTIGDVVHARSTLGMIINLPRFHSKQFGGGTTLELGIYAAYFNQLVFRGEKPEKILAIGSLNHEGVDESVDVILHYSGNRSATFSTSSKIKMDCEAEAIGTKGTLKLSNPFWCSTRLTTPNGIQEFPFKDDPDAKYNFINSAGLAYEAQHVRECLRKNLLESPVVSHAETLLVAQILEEILKQIGVNYET